MIATCPNCETRFDIPDDKYRPGRKARCSNCGFVFPLPELEDAGSPPSGGSRETVPPPPPVPDAPREPENDRAAPTGDMGSDNGAFPAQSVSPNDAKPDGPPSADTAASPEDRSAMAQYDDVTVIPPPPSSLDAVVSPLAKILSAKRNPKKLFLVLGIILALALLSYGGIMVYSAFFAPVKSSDPVPVTGGDVVSSLGGRTGGADAEKEAARQAAVSRLALENVRQQTVPDNDQTGPMVVIEGTVVNNFTSPRDLILLQITLYDSKGNALVMREQYCGITLSLLQLRSLSKTALESALSNQVDILTNNTEIPPGGRVPFSTVFFDLPNTAYEFEVKIVDVQDPSAKK